MNRKILSRFAVIALLIYVASVPINWYCDASNKCSGIDFGNLSSLFFRGEEVDLNLQTLSDVEGLIFESESKAIKTRSGKVNMVQYFLKNNSGRPLRLEINFFVTPEEYKDLIENKKCLCSKNISLRKGEALKLSSKFKVNKEIYVNKNFKESKQPLNIIYRAYEKF